MISSHYKLQNPADFKKKNQTNLTSSDTTIH